MWTAVPNTGDFGVRRLLHVVPAVAVLAGDRLGVRGHHRVEHVLLGHAVVAGRAGDGLQLRPVGELLDLREVRVAVDAGEPGVPVDRAGERRLRGFLPLSGRFGVAGEAVVVGRRLRRGGVRQGEGGEDDEEKDEPGAKPGERVRLSAIGHGFPRADYSDRTGPLQ